MTEPTCKCISLADSMRLAFADVELPACPEHDAPEDFGGSSPIALNDDNALKAVLGAHLGAAGDAVNLNPNPNKPFDAA